MIKITPENVKEIQNLVDEAHQNNGFHDLDEALDLSYRVIKKAAKSLSVEPDANSVAAARVFFLASAIRSILYVSGSATNEGLMQEILRAIKKDCEIEAVP